VAIADGIIQKEEKQALHEIIKSHPWASDIEWSFNYETDKHQDPEYLYKRVLSICHQNGPDPEYKFLVEILEAVARASSSTELENKTIERFTTELTERFRHDTDLINSEPEE
jgi:tellurite resistance protein